MTPISPFAQALEINSSCKELNLFVKNLETILNAAPHCSINVTEHRSIHDICMKFFAQGASSILQGTIRNSDPFLALHVQDRGNNPGVLLFSFVNNYFSNVHIRENQAYDFFPSQLESAMILSILKEESHEYRLIPAK